MISRRLIRIKVFKVFFSSIKSESNSFIATEKELLRSCDKTLELYYFLMSLPYALKKVANERIEVGLKKYHPTEEEANPNYRFVNNRVISILENDPDIIPFCQKRGLNWQEHSSFVKKLYTQLLSRDYFVNYMNSLEDSFENDLKFIISFFENELEDSSDLETIIEDANLFWTDDLAFVLNVIISKITLLKESSKKVYHPEVFLKDEDRDFALRLLNVSMMRYNEYLDLISQYILNWEVDRLASTDVILIIMGIVEAVAFPNIPIKVTINEYVEISKYYSTQNSKTFVNGILDKVLATLLESGGIEKTGRGLVELSE